VVEAQPDATRPAEAAGLTDVRLFLSTEESGARATQRQGSAASFALLKLHWVRAMDFQIKGLPLAAFAPLFSLSDAELTPHAAVRVVADRKPGFPCRVSLCDAEPGESLLLLNFEHLPVASPYRSRHAIFVRENASEAQLAVNEIPQSLRGRLLAVRAFDPAGMMIDADVVPGIELAVTIRRLLEGSQAEYLHVHNAKPGCFAARVERA
jgi:hypothetical protein